MEGIVCSKLTANDGCCCGKKSPGQAAETAVRRTVQKQIGRNASIKKSQHVKKTVGEKRSYREVGQTVLHE